MDTYELINNLNESTVRAMLFDLMNVVEIKDNQIDALREETYGLRSQLCERPDHQFELADARAEISRLKDKIAKLETSLRQANPQLTEFEDKIAAGEYAKAWEIIPPDIKAQLDEAAQKTSSKIEQIKALRMNTTGLGLRECKEFVEARP